MKMIKEEEFNKLHIALRKFMFEMGLSVYESAMLLDCVREDLRADMVVPLLEKRIMKNLRGGSNTNPETEKKRERKRIH